MTSYTYLGTSALPCTLPSLADCLDDLGQPDAATIAAACGVSRGTAARWIRSGRAPRAHHALIFLCTRWALSDREIRMNESARLHAALYESAQREGRQLAQRIEMLAPLARAGAANEPIPPIFHGVFIASDEPGSRASPPNRSTRRAFRPYG